MQWTTETASTPDLPGLRAFVEVAQRLSFFEAAEALALSASALTRRIKRVESTLRLELFERTTRRVALTPASRELLPRARDALNALDECARWAEATSRAASEQLTIACVPSIARTLLPRLVSGFTRDGDGLRIRIVESHVAQLVRQIDAGDVDLGIGFLPSAYPGLLTDELMVDPYDLACPPGHPLAERPSVRWVDLRDQPLIVSGSGRESGNRKVLDDALSGLTWAPTRPRPHPGGAPLPAGAATHGADRDRRSARPLTPGAAARGGLGGLSWASAVTTPGEAGRRRQPGALSRPSRMSAPCAQQEWVPLHSLCGSAIRHTGPSAKRLQSISSASERCVFSFVMKVTR